MSTIRVSTAPSSSSSARTCRASTGRSPLSIRTAPSSPPDASTAVRTARGTSYVSTSSVVPLPSDSSWLANACRSLSWIRVKACALIPALGMPNSYRARRFEVDAKPAM